MEHPDQNLVLGALALQTSLVTREALLGALREWTPGKSKTLAQILAEHGSLSTDERVLLEGLAAKHVERNNNDPGRSLAAVFSADSAKDVINQFSRPEHQTSWVADRIGDDPRDPHATLPLSVSKSTPSVGPSTSSGARFHILRPHARGGLGEVFLALDTELQREVALKRIQDGPVHDPRSRSRFLIEAEVTGRLEHPGVVPVYGLGTNADGRPYYVMRFIRGESLKDAIEQFHRTPSHGNLALRQLLVRIMNVCDAIGYAHSRGVLHRDIKPANIMLGGFGEIRLARRTSRLSIRNPMLEAAGWITEKLQPPFDRKQPTSSFDLSPQHAVLRDRRHDLISGTGRRLC